MVYKKASEMEDGEERRSEERRRSVYIWREAGDPTPWMGDNATVNGVNGLPEWAANGKAEV